MLDTRGDVHRLAEVVLPLVEAYGDAGALVDADLQQQILTAARLVEFSHRLAHAQGGGDRPVGCRKGRHHRVAACFQPARKSVRYGKGVSVSVALWRCRML